MKNYVLALALAGVVASPVYAADSFTGFGLGVDISSSKYSQFEDISFKRTTGLGLAANYGFNFGDSNFVGIVEAKVKLNKEKIINSHYNYPDENVSNHLRVDEKLNYSISYLQGYRVSDNFLPYAKLGYGFSKLKGKDNFIYDDTPGVEHISGTAKGILYGIGFKYAVNQNLELGAEYVRSNLKFEDVKFKKNTFSVNATYRF